MRISLQAKSLEVTSQIRKAFVFKTHNHYQGYVEDVVKATDVSIGPRRGNKLASMCALLVWTLYTAHSLSFYLLTNTKLVKADRTFAAHCIARSATFSGVSTGGGIL